VVRRTDQGGAEAGACQVREATATFEPPSDHSQPFEASESATDTPAGEPPAKALFEQFNLTDRIGPAYEGFHPFFSSAYSRVQALKLAMAYESDAGRKFDLVMLSRFDYCVCQDPPIDCSAYMLAPGRLFTMGMFNYFQGRTVDLVPRQGQLPVIVVLPPSS
jgi:hypothetical protein